MATLFSIVTMLSMGLALECIFQEDLSSCKPGREIALFKYYGSQKYILQPRELQDDQTSMNFGEKCQKITDCLGKNLHKYLNFHLQDFANTNVPQCLQEYCEFMNTTEFCCSEKITSSTDASSTFTIQIATDKEIANPVCSIGLSKAVQSTIYLKCSWQKEYVGINSTITISGLENNGKANCNGTLEGNLQMMNLSPWELLHNQSQAYCSLQIPSIKSQPKCDYSQFINPQVRVVSVGEYVNVTCPQDSSLLTWKIITHNESLNLNVSSLTIVYLAKRVYENGFIIMCTLKSGYEETVLGMGKVIVREKTEVLSETTTNISTADAYNSSEHCCETFMTTTTTHTIAASSEQYMYVISIPATVLFVLVVAALFILQYCFINKKSSHKSCMKQEGRKISKSTPMDHDFAAYTGIPTENVNFTGSPNCSSIEHCLGRTNDTISQLNKSTTSLPCSVSCLTNTSKRINLSKSTSHLHSVQQSSNVTLLSLTNLDSHTCIDKEIERVNNSAKSKKTQIFEGSKNGCNTEVLDVLFDSHNYELLSLPCEETLNAKEKLNAEETLNALEPSTASDTHSSLSFNAEVHVEEGEPKHLQQTPNLENNTILGSSHEELDMLFASPNYELLSFPSTEILTAPGPSNLQGLPQNNLHDQETPQTPSCQLNK